MHLQQRILNAGIIHAMLAADEKGADTVCASRFIPGGCRFRLFSRRVVEGIEIESDTGFCYSLEMLVKCHRLGWPIVAVPAQWFERKQGASRFEVLEWVPAYLRWYWYAFATTFLRLPANSV